MKKPACTAVALATATVIAPATRRTVAPAHVAARWPQPRSAALRAGLAVLTLLLAACGGSDSAPNASATVAASAASANPPSAPGAARGFSQVSLVSQVSTVAGSGQDGHIDSAASRAAASFHQPLGVVAHSQGHVYVADTLNHQIRKIMANGQVLTWAGSGRPGAADDSLVVADTGNHRVRQISRSGRVSTLAGSGAPGVADGAGPAASFNSPSGIAAGGAGAAYIGDTANHKIRRLDGSGAVSTLAGTG